MSWGRSNWMTPGYTPNSQGVQSDDEWSKGWQDRLAAVPRFMQKEWTPSWQGANIANIAGGDTSAIMGIGAAERLANSFGTTMNRNADGSISAGFAADSPQNDPAVAQGLQFDNPAWGALNDQYQKAQQDRAYDQNRQTQAYGQMQGGNYFGGMIDGRYGEAFNGQMQQGGTSANGDPTSSSGWGAGAAGAPGAPGQSTFGEAFGQKPKQYRAGSWGSYG